MTPAIDGDRLLLRLEELARIGATASGGVTRQAWSPEDLAARDVVAGWMAEAGLDVTVDAAANLLGRRPGRTGRWLATGSHLDTVIDAGPYDGAYGVVAAVEVAAALDTADLDHGILVAAFANEEGARGTAGMTGSHACAGRLDAAALAQVDDDGATVAERIRAAGGDPERDCHRRRGLAPARCSTPSSSSTSSRALCSPPPECRSV